MAGCPAEGYKTRAQCCFMVPQGSGRTLLFY